MPVQQREKDEGGEKVKGQSFLKTLHHHLILEPKKSMLTQKSVCFFIYGSSPKELLKNRFMQGIHTSVCDPLCSTFLRKSADSLNSPPFVPPLLIREGDRG